MHTTVMTTGYRGLAIFLSLAFSIALGCERKAPTPSGSPGNSTSQSLLVVSYGGGAYQDSHKKAFTEPFAAKENMRVDSATWGAEYGRLQEMVASGKVPWNVVEVTAAQYSRGVKDGLFAPLESRPSPDHFKPLPNGPGVTEYGVPNVYWSTVLAYSKAQFPDTPPTNWADFFDQSRFPGPRAIYDDPRGNLEFALLADGVAMQDLYPLDVDRAFRKLDTIKKHVRVWWKDGTEPVQLLLSGQVAMSTAWSGRIYASPDAKPRLGFTWKGAAHELDYWVIPKGASNVGVAAKFIRFASLPENLQQQAQLVAYGPANALALDGMDPELLRFLPTAPDNWNVSFLVNADWWAEHEQEVKSRWILWKNQ